MRLQNIGSTHMARLAPACFVITSLLIYWVASLPLGSRATAYIVLHAALTALIGGAYILKARTKPLLTAAIISQIALIYVTPFTSNDWTRYLWDGHLLSLGLDPYLVSPNNVSNLVDTYWPFPKDNTNYTTLYPPLSLGLFYLLAKLGPIFSFWGLKFVLAVAAIATMLIGSRPLLIFAPLIILESSVGLHIDVLCALTVAIFLRCKNCKMPLIAGIALGVGGLIKLFPMLILLPLILSKDKFKVTTTIAACGVFLGGYLIAYTLGLVPIGSLGTFAKTWYFGSPIFSAISYLSFLNYPRLICLCAASVLSCLFAANIRDFKRIAPLALFTFMVFSPVLFPWYSLTLLPILALSPNLVISAFVLALPVTYEVIDNYNQLGIWAPATWPLLTIASIPFLAIAFNCIEPKARQSSSLSQSESGRSTDNDPNFVVSPDKSRQVV